jgi:hypothetical protein
MFASLAAISRPATRLLDVAVNAIADRRAVAPAARQSWSCEALILQTLRENEGIGLEAVVVRVADEMLRAEQLAGAWTTDIAVWGPALCRRETMQAVRRMLGRSIVLEAEGDGPWLAVPVGTL